MLKITLKTNEPFQMYLRDKVVFVQFANKYTRPYQCGEMIYVHIV